MPDRSHWDGLKQTGDQKYTQRQNASQGDREEENEKGKEEEESGQEEEEEVEELPDADMLEDVTQHIIKFNQKMPEASCNNCISLHNCFFS